MTEFASRHHWLYPAAVWLIVLSTVFVTEYAVMLVLPWLLPSEPLRFVEAMVDAILLTTALAPVMWWTVVRPLREVIQLRARFLMDLFSRIEADRREVAHELHDGVGQSVSLLISGMRSAQEHLREPEIVERWGKLLSLAQGTLKDVKRMALGLRPSLLDDLGLAPALEALVADVRDHHAMNVRLDAGAVAGRRFPPAVETAVYRIIQEALANVTKHASAQMATVSVRSDGAVLSIEVTDDGVGMSASAPRPGHLGLVGMRERCLLMGGAFAIDSTPGHGTRIRARIPIGE